MCLCIPKSRCDLALFGKTLFKWEELAAATENDSVLQRVICGITEGEAKCRNPYVTFVYELSVVDGVLLKGERVVVPESLKAQMLTLIHEGHFGIEKCKRRARDVLYWPNLNKDVYETVSRCDVCQEYIYAQPKEPLTMHERPDRPWAKVGCDLFLLKQIPYLLTVDYYSHYPEISLLSNESGRQVIVQLKSLFSRHGFPSTLMSDGGPQFSSAEFKQFTKEWGIERKMSSPYYPQSNGIVENCVKVVKRILGKAADRGEDPPSPCLHIDRHLLTVESRHPSHCLAERSDHACHIDVRRISQSLHLAIVGNLRWRYIQTTPCA